MTNLDRIAREYAERYEVDPDALAYSVRRALARRLARAAQAFKVCPVCGRDLPAKAYASDESKGDGLKVVCRECDNRRRRPPTTGALLK
jgi:hypothetical protein